MRKLLSFLVFLILLVPPALHAQVAVSASDIADAFMRPLGSAKLCFAPVDATESPTGFRVGSIQVVPGSVCGLVSNGVLQGGLTLAPSPSGVFYRIWAENRTTGTVIRDYGMTPITGTSWTMDTYDPNLATLPVTMITMGTVTTLPAGEGGYCTITGTSPYVLNCGVPTGAAANLTIGAVTTLASGSSATASVSGSNPNYVLNLGIPAGPTGPVARTIQTTFNGHGNPVVAPSASTPSTCTVVPGNFTLQSWTVVADVAGAVTFDVDVAPASTTATPGSSYSIVGTVHPTLSGSNYATSSTLTGWTTSIAAGSAVCINITAASGVANVSLILGLEG
jgi:hypothetical protein